MSSPGLRDMTRGSVLCHLFTFSVPLLLGNLMQQLYNMVDSWVAGNFIGDTALTAVGAGFSVMSLFISLFSGVGIGVTVTVAQSFGAQQMERVQRTINSVYRMILLAAVPVTIVAFLGTDLFLSVLHVDPVAVPDARRYLRVISLGLISTIGYNINDGILRGLGNSRASLLFLAISACINAGLDLLLVAVFSAGVAGAAVATILAQTISWLLGVCYINRVYQQFPIRPWKGDFDGKMLRSVISIGLPAGIQTATVSLGGVAVMAKVNTFGNSYSAGYSVGLKIEDMVFLPIQSCSNAATAIVGQNVGAGRDDRVRQTAKCVVSVCLIWCAASVAVIYPNRSLLIGLFTRTQETIACGSLFVGCVLPAYFLLAVLFSLNSVMRGAGESAVPMLVAIIGMIFLRIPAVYLLADWLGPEYMFYGFGIGWSVGVVLGVSYFLSGRWKRKRLTVAEKSV